MAPNDIAVLTLPEYLSHKKVRALKIAKVEHLGTDHTTFENRLVRCHFEAAEFGPRDFNLRGKPTPEAGWYMVQYEDGYTSFSPAKAFEEGNALIIPEQSAAESKDLRSFDQDVIDNWFTYHAPTPEQLVQYREIRTAAKIFAETINRHVPAGADKTAAMRKVREATMTANAAIACD